MQTHELKRRSPNKKKALVGRGGKRGKTSGRGTKGQKARAGRKMRPELRDIIKKLPKRRGYRFNPVSEKPVSVNISVIESTFSGSIVSPETLVAEGIVKKRGGKNPTIKILAKGDIRKKFTVERCLVSKSAQEKIEKAGGTIVKK